MRIDMHVHTSKYSPCAKADADQMVSAALKAGLDGIVITEHNVMWGVDELEQLRERYPEIKIFSGVEVAVKGGDDCLVYGISSPDVFQRDMPICELIKNVREDGGIVVIAHPYRYRDYVPAEIFDYPTDGVEIMSCNILAYMKDRVHELCNKLGALEIAGSDAHNTTYVGVFATDFSDKITNEKELVSAIKSRNYSLYMNTKEVERINKNIIEKAALACKLIDEGMSNELLRKNYSIPYSMSYALRNGKDIRLIK